MTKILQGTISVHILFLKGADTACIAGSKEML
jgi:hypothetical protein